VLPNARKKAENLRHEANHTSNGNKLLHTLQQLKKKLKNSKIFHKKQAKTKHKAN
jgi:hypothetical protein